MIRSYSVQTSSLRLSHPQKYSARTIERNDVYEHEPFRIRLRKPQNLAPIFTGAKAKKTEEAVEEPTCHLLRLPVELRLTIYRYLLCPPNRRIRIRNTPSEYHQRLQMTYSASYDTQFYPPALSRLLIHLAIVRTNRQIQM